MTRRYVYNAICTMPECGTKHEARGFCKKHYARFLRFGDASVTLKNRKVLTGLTDAERLASALDKTPGLGPKGECWEWKGIRPNGYGEIAVNGRKMKAHRLAWQLANGRKPKLDILHSCDNPPCCNPSHLREGTHLENMRDMVERGRLDVHPSYGEANGWAKLTTDAVLSIRERLAAGEPQRRIAKGFGVTQATISLINRGQRWTHI